MRSILYVAAVLMIGASIYGFVDYSKTKDSKEFADMYDKKETIIPAVTEEKEPADDIPSVNKKDEPVTVTKEDNKNVKANKKEGIVRKIANKFKKKRKIDLESFSRAPLREEAVVDISEIKEETKKEQ